MLLDCLQESAIYAAIERRTSWAQPLNVSAAIRDELSFWLSNIDTLNGRVMSPKSSAVGVVYSDASDYGFGGYFVQCGVDLVSGVWSEDQMHSSSTFREILAVKFVLLSLVNQLSGMTVKWFTDNQNVPRIISSGSSKGHLQSEALSVFNICCNYAFRLRWNGSRDLRMIGQIILVAFLTRTIGAFRLFLFTELTKLGVLIRLIVSQII